MRSQWYITTDTADLLFRNPNLFVLQHNNYYSTLRSMHDYCHIQAVVVITIIVMVVCGLFFY